MVTIDLNVALRVLKERTSKAPSLSTLLGQDLEMREWIRGFFKEQNEEGLRWINAQLNLSERVNYFFQDFLIGDKNKIEFLLFALNNAKTKDQKNDIINVINEALQNKKISKEVVTETVYSFLKYSWSSDLKSRLDWIDRSRSIDQNSNDWLLWGNSLKDDNIGNCIGLLLFVDNFKEDSAQAKITDWIETSLQEFDYEEKFNIILNRLIIKKFNQFHSDALKKERFLRNVEGCIKSCKKTGDFSKLKGILKQVSGKKESPLWWYRWIQSGLESDWIKNYFKVEEKELKKGFKNKVRI